MVSKLNPGLGNKYEKVKMLRDIESAKNVTHVTGLPCVFTASYMVSLCFELP